MVDLEKMFREGKLRREARERAKKISIQKRKEKERIKSEETQRKKNLKDILEELKSRKRREKEKRKSGKILKEVRYKKSGAGKINRFMKSGFNVGRVGIVKSLYSREQPISPSTKVGGITKTGGIRTGRRGRPKGSYDLRYARYGGVYGWRKAQAQQRRLQTLQVQRQVQVSPQQEIALSRMQRTRESEGNMIKISPGGVATVSGEVPGMAQYHRDVKKWTNLVD